TPLGGAVGKFGNVGLADGPVYLLRKLPGVDAVKPAVVGNVFPRRQVRVETRAVRQRADAATRLQPFGDDIGAIYVGTAFVRFQDGVEDPQRCRLAGAIRSQQARYPAVGRLEADAVYRLDVAEGFLESADPDHGEGPVYSRKNVIANCRSDRHASSQHS